MTRHIALFTLLIAAGCSSQPATPPASEPAAGAPAAATAPKPTASRTVEITGNDSMKFNVTEIVASRGETLAVTLVNTGTTPKFSMGHNWVLLAAGTDPQAFVVAAAEAVTTDYVPASQKAQIIAATKLLGPKERDTVTFTVPATPGRYEFVCSFPGHFQVGMRGVLIVR